MRGTKNWLTRDWCDKRADSNTYNNNSMRWRDGTVGHTFIDCTKIKYQFFPFMMASSSSINGALRCTTLTAAYCFDIHFFEIWEFPLSYHRLTYFIYIFFSRLPLLNASCVLRPFACRWFGNFSHFRASICCDVVMVSENYERWLAAGI